MVLKASGSISLSADLAFGYDTFGLQQWADADYASNQFTNVFNGFYIDDEIKEVKNKDGSSKIGRDGKPETKDEAEFKLSLGVELGGGIGVAKKGLGLWGGPYGELKGDLEFDLNDPNNDGKFRGSELLSQLYQGKPVRFSGASVRAKLGAKVEASAGGKNTKLSTSLVDFTFLEHTLYEYKAGAANNQLSNLPNQDAKDMAKRMEDEVETGSRVMLAGAVLGASLGPAGAAAGATAAVVTYKVVKWVGALLDEPIAGADVFFDANFNGVRDDNEPMTQTDSDGSYVIDLDMSLFDKNQDGQINSNEGQWVGTGGYDSYAGLVQQQILIAAGNAIAITPLTTLVSAMMQQSITSSTLPKRTL